MHSSRLLDKINQLLSRLISKSCSVSRIVRPCIRLSPKVIDSSYPSRSTKSLPMESSSRTNSRSVLLDNKLIAIVLACLQSTSTRIKVHFTTASLNWSRSGMILTERAWNCLGTLMEKRRDCLWITAARRKRKCARSFGKSRRMFREHPAHFKALSNLINLYTRVKILSTTC